MKTNFSKSIERLIFQVEKQNQEAAAISLVKGIPALRRGSGVGQIVDLRIALHVEGANGKQDLVYAWPNSKKILPPLVMFSLHACGRNSARPTPEDLAIFLLNEDIKDDEEPFLVFATGSSNDFAIGYIRIIEESLEGVLYAWLVFICQEEGLNKTTTLFNNHEIIRALSQTIECGLPLGRDPIVTTGVPDHTQIADDRTEYYI